jgi:hypothetical protein
MTTTQDPGQTDIPVARPPAGTPGLVVPIFFGLLGAWWASDKARTLGVADTKRYWIAAAISTGVVFLAAVLVPVLVIFVLAAALGGTSSSVSSTPAAQAPRAGSAPVAPAAAKSFIAGPADAAIPLADRLKAADGLPAASPTTAHATDRIDTILTSFNAAWKASCTGSNNLPEPRYLWSFVQEPKGHFYTIWGVQQPTVCGSLALANEPSVTADPQAAAGVTSRWYEVRTSYQNSGQQGGELPMLIRFVENRWMLVGLSPLGLSLDTLETGQSVTEDQATVIAQMMALREQAFIQRSDDLLTVYYDGMNRDQPNINQPDQALMKAGIVPIITLDKVVRPGSVDGRIYIESTERQGNHVVHLPATYTWYREAPGAISGIWVGDNS